MYIWDVLENRTRKMSAKEFFDFNGGSWRSYYRDLVRGSFLNEVYFQFEEIEKSIAVLEEDGEILKLKNGDWVHVCWRGEQCRIWKEQDEEVCGELDLHFCC